MSKIKKNAATKVKSFQYITLLLFYLVIRKDKNKQLGQLVLNKNGGQLMTTAGN